MRPSLVILGLCLLFAAAIALLTHSQAWLAVLDLGVALTSITAAALPVSAKVRAVPPLLATALLLFFGTGLAVHPLDWLPWFNIGAGLSYAVIFAIGTRW